MAARRQRATKNPVCTAATLRYVFTDPWVAVCEWRPLDSPATCWVAWPVRSGATSTLVGDVLEANRMPVPLDFTDPDRGFVAGPRARAGAGTSDEDDGYGFGDSLDTMAVAPAGRVYYGGMADRATVRALNGATRVRVLDAQKPGWVAVTVNTVREDVAGPRAPWAVLDLTVHGPVASGAYFSDIEYSDFSEDDE